MDLHWKKSISQLCSNYFIAVATRFKLNKKYTYQYTTESRNAGAGAANLWNGAKMSCQVCT